MQDGPGKSRRRFLWLMAICLAFAVLSNGLVWAIRVPPLHPADEPQHYMYAATFDGTSPGLEPVNNKVPRDLQALSELVEFGPHRELRFEIDLSDERAEEIQRLQQIADDPANASVLVEDSEANFLISHQGFNNYHPPFYYSLTGQALRVGHWLGFGVRGRLLMGRLFSVFLSCLAAWLAMLLARRVWPKRWGLPALVGLAVSWQALIAFFTSVVNNEAMTSLLFTLFLLIGASLIVEKPRIRKVFTLIGVGLLAAFTKISMIALIPLGLAAIIFSKVSRKLRISAMVLFGLFFVVSLVWLLTPLSGGESMITKYTDLDAEPRSFPAEMFTPKRIWQFHIATATQNWGRFLGNAVNTDAKVPDKVYYGYMAFTAIALLSGLVLFFKASSIQRKVLFWIGMAPFMVLGLFYSIDYRFASLAGGWFNSRPQYFIPTAAAQMIWIVWGLTGWIKGRLLVAVTAVFASGMAAFNLWVLVRIVSLRYYVNTGWWEQYEQIATLWPLPPWLIAGTDIFAILASLAAVVMVILCTRQESLRDAQA